MHFPGKKCKGVTCVYHDKQMKECLCYCWTCLTKFEQINHLQQGFFKCLKCPGLICTQCKLRIDNKNSYCKCKCITCHDLLAFYTPSENPIKCESCVTTCDLCLVDFKLGLSRICSSCMRGFCRCCVMGNSKEKETSKKSMKKELKENSMKLDHILTSAKRIDRENFCVYCK